MKEVILFGSKVNINRCDNMKDETKTFFVSRTFFIVAILLIFCLVSLPFIKCYWLGVEKSPHVNSTSFTDNILAITSLIIGGIALIITILTVVKEIHSSRVRSLKDKIEKNQRTIVKLSNSWLVLYETGTQLSSGKPDFDNTRRQIREDKGICELLKPSEVKSFIEENTI